MQCFQDQSRSRWSPLALFFVIPSISVTKSLRSSWMHQSPVQTIVTRECGAPTNPSLVGGHAARPKHVSIASGGYPHTQSSKTRTCSTQINVHLGSLCDQPSLLVPSSYMLWWVFCQPPSCWLVGLNLYSQNSHFLSFYFYGLPAYICSESWRYPPPMPSGD